MDCKCIHFFIVYLPLLLHQKHYSWILKSNEINLKEQKKLNGQIQKMMTLVLAITTYKEKSFKIFDIEQTKHLNGLHYVSHLFQR